MDILSALQTEASKLQQQLDTINSAIKVLGGGNSTGSGVGSITASRAKMARAQRERWAKVRAAKKNA